MAALNVKKGDNVMVITGKDKGKSGKVLKVDTAKGRIYVEGVNIVSKSKKPTSAQDKGGIVKKEGKICIHEVSEERPNEVAVSVNPELEDVYTFYFGEKVNHE